MKKLSRKKEFVVGLFDTIAKPFVFLGRCLTGTRGGSYGEIKKILILELWGIGDVVMVTPALKELREAFPEANIFLLAKPHADVLLSGSPYVDEVVAYDFPWTAFTGKYRLWQYNIYEVLSLLSRLRKERFDLAVCARMDIRNNFLMFIVGAKRRVGYDHAGGGPFLTDVVSVDFNHPHRVHEWLRLLEYLGIRVGNPKPRLYVAASERKRAEDELRRWRVEAGDLIIGIHPGARIPVRRWDLRKFSSLADILIEKYRAKILIFVDPDGYASEMPMRNKPIILRPSLRELMAFIEKCRLLICNDSGPMHLATAVGTPVVSVLGPTKPEWFGPYGKEHRLVIQENFPCRPCFDNCIFKEPYCLTTISLEQVLLVVEEQLANSALVSR